MKSKILGLLAVGLLSGPITANAVVVFNLNGFVFDDPNRPNKAVLTLSDTYSSGSAILASDFVSFELIGPNWIGNLWTPPTWTLNPTGNSFPSGTGIILDFGSALREVRFTLSGGTLQQYFQGRAITYMSSITITDVTPRPAPEPGTLALLCLGLAGLGLSRRRRA